MKTNLGLFSKIGCFIIGWNPDILSECGEASYAQLRKYVSSLCILSIIWGTIGYQVAEKYMGIETLIGRIFVALLFLTIIISIERFIILTVHLGWETKFFRYGIAALMATLGATVFDQIFFSQDIEKKMIEVRTEQINKEIPLRTIEIEKRISQLNQSSDSIIKKIERLQEIVNKKPTVSTTDYNTISREDGIDENGNPKIQKTVTATTVSRPNPAQAQLDMCQKTLDEQRAEIIRLEDKKIQMADVVKKEFDEKKAGFLEELTVLFNKIVFSDRIAGFFYLFVFLFLGFLELLVIQAKSGNSCDYDLIIQHQVDIKRNSLQKTKDNLTNV